MGGHLHRRLAESAPTMVQDDVGEAGYPGQIPAQLPHPPIPAPPGVPHHRRRVTDHAIVDTQVGLVLQDGNSVLALIEFPDAASRAGLPDRPAPSRDHGRGRRRRGTGHQHVVRGLRGDVLSTRRAPVQKGSRTGSPSRRRPTTDFEREFPDGSESANACAMALIHTGETFLARIDEALRHHPCPGPDARPSPSSTEPGNPWRLPPSPSGSS